MAGTARIPKAEIGGLRGMLVKRFSKKRFGGVPEPIEVCWHHQPVLKLTFGLGRKSNKWKECDENLKAFAHMAVASYVGCSWCLDFGYFMAHHEGLDIEKARQVPGWRESEGFTPLERQVMGYAEAMSQTPSGVTNEMSERLMEALGAPALIELTAFIALANFYTRMNTAIGIEAQGLSASCGLDPLSEPSSEVASAL